MATKRQITAWVKQLDKRKAAVALERGKLDSFIGELSDLVDCCDKALDALQNARDALSEFV